MRRPGLSGLVVAALIAVACGGQDGGGGATPGATPGGNGEQPTPAARQELVVAYGADQFQLELNKKRLGMYPLNANICEPPVQLTEDFQVAPLLATDWEYVGENTYRFTLREGVTFHDGSELTAEDAEYSIDLTTEEPETNYSFLDAGSATATGDMQLEITPTQQNVRLIDQMTHPTYSVMPSGTDPTVEPVCTGPFRFVEYVENDHLTVERNDDYWGEPAQLERITFRFIPDAATRVLALQSQEVDAIADVDRAQVSSLRQQSGVKVVTAPPGQVIVLYIAQRGSDGSEKITADPAVRRAIAHAIDREGLVNGVLDGNAEVVSTVNPPSVLGERADRIEGVAHDPERARRVLDEAGWTQPGGGQVRSKAGQPLALTMIYDSSRVSADVAQYVQAQLAEVGIQADIEQLDKAAYQERIDTGQYDLDIEAPNQNDSNPAFLLALRWYSKSKVRNAQYVSIGPAYDALIDQALSEPDREEVKRIAAEAMQLLVDEEVGTVPLAGTFRIYAVSEKVQGFEPHPSGINQSWATVWLSE
ncbi:MAG: hypothetical protein KY462_00730 [Actinobacteria bacterium]|nr:hypothetical protein [Actinomycetota bacterium]